MKRIPLEQLRQATGNTWHDAFRVGKLVDGIAVEVPDDFPITAPAIIPAAPAAIQSTLHTLFTSLKASDATQAARLAVCQVCEFNRAGNCAKCQTCGGRPVAHKVKRLDETCPESKWPVLATLEPTGQPTG